MNHQDQYKRRPAGFRETNDSRLVRAGRQEERRRLNRAQNFARHRNVLRDPEEERTTRRSDLSVRLRRWKEERALKKKIEEQKKKPVFKVGVVHHNFYSPPYSDRHKQEAQPRHRKLGQKVNSQESLPKRITRATQKRLQARNLANALTPVVASRSKVSPMPERVRRKPRRSANNSVTQSFAPANHVFKVPTGITEIPMFGRIAVPDISALTLDLETDIKTAWPTVGNILNNAGSPQNTKGRLERCMAVEEPLSPTSLEAISNQNSSTDFCLHLSADDDSTEEAPAKDDPLSAEDVDVKIATPPRSGTPVPASFSPYIVTSRGKDSARKEQKDRMGIRRSSANEIPTKDTVMQSLNISVEEEEQTAHYFKSLMLRETDRLNDLCTKWNVLRSDPTLSEDAASQIVAAIGQTQLLIRKKIERFRNLIHDCETGKGQMLVTCKDLRGFWDLIDREIKDCDARFLKLEFLKENDWIEEEAVVTKVTKKKAAPAKTKAKINAKSSARSWIMAARKKKMAQDAGLDGDVIATPGFVEEARSTSRMNGTPKESERIRRTTSTPKTPTSLLKTVRLSEASKNIRSPLAVMKVTKMFKTPEVTMDDTISYVNSDQTPGKGILKKSEESSGSESVPSKSSRKVDFSDDVFLEEFPAAEVDEALQNSIDLGRALARIESYDSESNFDPVRNITVRTAEKCLDFEDESFDEAEDTRTAESATIVAAPPEPTIVPNVTITGPTPLKTTMKQTPSKNRGRSSRRASKVRLEEVEESPNTRVLRNRMVVVETANNRNRRSTRLSVLDETNTRATKASTKENADPQRGAEKETTSDLHNVLGTDQENEDNTKRRRSTRKSVRFNPDDCTACGEAPKPVQPMTPHARRSRKVSLLGNQTSELVEPFIGGDLMSFDTPAKIPSRIRRLSRK